MPSMRSWDTGRNCRGAGWHRKGYRDRGCMWLNIKHAYCVRPFVRGTDVDETYTLGEFLQLLPNLLKGTDGFPLPEACYIDAQTWGRSLWNEPVDARIIDYFDGGETVTVKASDANGRQILHDIWEGWAIK